MARQESIIKLKGTIGGISFYKSNDGYIAREKSGLDGSRISTDPAFKRTRENNAEFANSGKAAKLFRDALRPLMRYACDGNVVARSTRMMSQIKNMDTTSERGKRTVAKGVSNPEAMGLLKGFSFNTQAPMSSVLFANYTINGATSQFSFPNLVADRDIKIPPGATHVMLKGGVAVIDFAAGTSDMVLTGSMSYMIDSQPKNITLLAPTAPAGTGTRLFLLSVQFFQAVNGTQYVLSNGQYNALGIVEVDEVGE